MFQSSSFLRVGEDNQVEDFEEDNIHEGML